MTTAAISTVFNVLQLLFKNISSLLEYPVQLRAQLFYVKGIFSYNVIHVHDEKYSLISKMFKLHTIKC